MKKLLALLLAVMMVLGLAACSNGQESEETTTVTVADVLEDINDENLESIALYYNTGSGSTSAAALPDDLTDFGTALKEVNTALTDVEATEIEKSEISETNIAYILKNGQTNLYVYNDGNLKVAKDLKSTCYSVGTEVTDGIVATLDTYLDSISAE